MARFCTACGTPLADKTVRFCTKCGAAAAAPPKSSVAASSARVSERKGKTIAIAMAGVVTLLVIIAGVFAGSDSHGVRANKPLSQQPSYKPSHLTFRGLRAGQSQKEVWAIVKTNAADADFLNIANDPKTHCDLDKGSGYVFCEGGHSSLVFSHEGKLIKFQVSIFYYGDNPEGFFAALRKELAADNGGEGTEGSAIFPIGKNPLPKFTWRTDQTVGGCFDDPKGDCPSETIVYLEQRPTRADIEFTDNAYFKYPPQ